MIYLRFSKCLAFARHRAVISKVGTHRFVGRQRCLKTSLRHKLQWRHLQNALGSSQGGTPSLEKEGGASQRMIGICPGEGNGSQKRGLWTDEDLGGYSLSCLYHVLIMGQSRRWQDKKVRRRGKFVKSRACNHKELGFTTQATEVRNCSQHS